MAKNVFIMGATSGIGEALAERLAAEGCRLAIAGRREVRLYEIASSLEKKYGGEVDTVTVDVRSEGAPAAIREAASRMGGLDLYIHCSGMGFENKALDPAVESETADTNVPGFVRCVDEAVALLREAGRGGQLAAISSVAAVRGLGASPAYSASKAFQAHYLEALRQSAAAQGWGIAITDIRPGFVDTPFLRGTRYPMTMPLEKTADSIHRAILAKKSIAWIDWRYAILMALAALIPSCVWCRLPIGFSGDKPSTKAADDGMQENPEDEEEAAAGAAPEDEEPDGGEEKPGGEETGDDGESREKGAAK